MFEEEEEGTKSELKRGDRGRALMMMIGDDDDEM